VKKSIEYCTNKSNLDWYDFLRFNILSSTNETVESLSLISMADLFKLNEYIEIKSFIENVQYAVQEDEMKAASNKK
jgi:hypothetical protein